jgi:acetate kinase
VTAVYRGKSIETTGGFGPVSGLPMGSRAGEIDAGALLELMEKTNLRPKEASLYLQHSGGLRGLGGDDDIRTLLDKKAHGDKAACLALEHFSYHLQKAIAAATISLCGVDAIVFTGTAAVRSAELRRMIMARLEHLGITLDEDKNDVLVGKSGVIHQSGAIVKVAVMPSEEMLVMLNAATVFLKE